MTALPTQRLLLAALVLAVGIGIGLAIAHATRGGESDTVSQSYDATPNPVVIGKSLPSTSRGLCITVAYGLHQADVCYVGDRVACYREARIGQVLPAYVLDNGRWVACR